MIPYLLPLFFILYGIIEYDINKHVRGRLVLWIGIFTYFFLLIGLRYEVGGDTINYMSDYYWRGPLSSWHYSVFDKFEPGYSLLCSLGKTISPDFYVFQLIHSFILNTALSIWIYKNTKYIFSSFLILFLTNYLYFSTEVLREVIAVIIFLFNYKNLRNHRWIRYYIGVVFSMCFHLSAIILVMMPLIVNLKFNKKYTFLLLTMIVLGVFSNKIFSILLSFPLIGEKVNGYMDIGSIGILAGGFKFLTGGLVPIIFGYIATNKGKSEIKFEGMVAGMGLLGVLILVSPIVFGRFSNYFIIFFCVSFGTWIGTYIRSHSPVKRHNTIILASLFCLVSLVGFKLYNKYTLWVPYYSIFNKVHVNREYADKMLLKQ
ncbi:MAG: EpsG family protein [Bacteroidales bacterium]|nr:EpsG family protein [Bacteroidales bacterium]